MPKGWKTFVYEATEEDPRKFRGFFYDEADAQSWIKKQTEGTFEVSDVPPERKESP